MVKTTQVPGQAAIFANAVVASVLVYAVMRNGAQWRCPDTGEE